MKKEELTEALIDSQLNEQEGAEDEQKVRIPEKL